MKEIENISPMFSYVIETIVEVWENSKLRGNVRPARIPVLPETSTCVSVTGQKMFSITYKYYITII